MSESIRVAVSGAGGRMGREVINTVLQAAPETTLAAASDPAFAGRTVSEALGLDSTVVIAEDLASSLTGSQADAAVIFCVPSAAMDDIRTCMEAGVVPIVGTTGITPENMAEIRSLSAKHGVGAIIAPNFSVGAILMMRFAAEAARYLPAVEIIDLHHDMKLDAPSGTAIKMAEMIAACRREEYRPPVEAAPSEARGQVFHGVPIHSVRLPGLVGHHEIIFGGPGQTLTIKQDNYDRKSYMPGVLLAIRKARGLTEVIYGLESIM